MFCFYPFFLFYPIFHCCPASRTLLLRHNLDAMHIEKNVCDSVIRILMNIKGKTKDNLRSCLDLKGIGIREELHPISHGKKVLLPCECYTLSTDEKRGFC